MHCVYRVPSCLGEHLGDGDKWFAMNSTGGINKIYANSLSPCDVQWPEPDSGRKQCEGDSLDQRCKKNVEIKIKENVKTLRDKNKKNVCKR